MNASENFCTNKIFYSFKNATKQLHATNNAASNIQKDISLKTKENTKVMLWKIKLLTFCSTLKLKYKQRQNYQFCFDVRHLKQTSKFYDVGN